MGSTRIIVLAAFAVLATLSNGFAQAVPKDPETRKKRPNWMDQLESSTKWDPREAAESNPAPAVPAPQTPPSGPSPFDAEIARLTRQLETTKPTAIDVPDGAVLLKRLNRYRELYSMMREYLYVDALQEPLAVSAIERFNARWAMVAPAFWTGDRSALNAAGPSWPTVVERVRTRKCPIAATIPDHLENKTLIDPTAWACLNDAYFADLAHHEALLGGTLANERGRLLQEVENAIVEADEWLRQTREQRRASPKNETLRAQFAQHIFRVWRAGATARRDELERLKKRGSGTPLEVFLSRAPVISRAAADVPRIEVNANHSVRLVLGRTESTVRVVERDNSSDPRGQRLHDLYYEYETLDQELDRAADQKLRDKELELIDRINSDALIDDARQTDAFRVGRAAAVKNISGERQAAEPRERARIQSEIKGILDKLATPDPSVRSRRK
jgi:hypothetical protein